MNDMHGIVYAFHSFPDLGPLQSPRTAASLPERRLLARIVPQRGSKSSASRAMPQFSAVTSVKEPANWMRLPLTKWMPVLKLSRLAPANSVHSKSPSTNPSACRRV